MHEHGVFARFRYNTSRLVFTDAAALGNVVPGG